MPKEKMYMEQSLRTDVIVPSTEKPLNELERTLLGRERINGILANKYRIVVQNGKEKCSAFLWLDSDSGLPVRTASEDGSWWQEYHNVKVGDLDPAIFQIPENYQPFSMSY
jgi:negative regulator of sigma E activity